MTENQLLNNLDELLDRFEFQWEFELSGAEGIRAFISAIGIDLPEKPLPSETPQLISFISDLVEIDMDRWWMYWNKSLQKLVKENTSAAEICKLFSRHASLEKYLGLLPAYSDAREVWQNLIDFEIQTRARSGDQIGTCYLSNRLDIERSVFDVPSNVELCLDRRDRHREPMFLFPLRGCTLVGRQRSFDDSPCFFQELPEVNRIVIAGRAEAEVSREQLTVQLLSPEYAVISNVSQTNPIAIGSVRRLAPTESTVVPLPVSISVANRILHVRPKYHD